MVKTLWRYWSGILRDENGLPRFGFMHATFEEPGVIPFKHTAIVDLETKKFYGGDHDTLGIAFPELPAPFTHTVHPTVPEEIHASEVLVLSGLVLEIGGIRHLNLTGELWYEKEERVVAPGETWRWMSLRLNDGRKLMVYDRSTRPLYSAVRKDKGAWEEANVSVEVLERDTYESKWSVQLGNETLFILPVAPEQEIVDEARGVRYLEALCTVYDGAGREVGSAYVELVPAARPRLVVESIPSEGEMHLRWAKGNKNAAFLISCFGYATQLADDLTDNNTENVSTLKKRSLAMSKLLYCLLIQIPGNRFFREHERHFIPLFPVLIAQWDASNEWAGATKPDTRMFGYVMREACGRLIEQVAYLVGGLDWLMQVAREIHDYYHGAHGVESFEAWSREGKEIAR
jgi:hypothetical protein